MRFKTREGFLVLIMPTDLCMLYYLTFSRTIYGQIEDVDQRAEHLWIGDRGAVLPVTE